MTVDTSLHHLTRIAERLFPADDTLRARVEEHATALLLRAQTVGMSSARSVNAVAFPAVCLQLAAQRLGVSCNTRLAVKLSSVKQTEYQTTMAYLDKRVPDRTSHGRSPSTPPRVRAGTANDGDACSTGATPASPSQLNMEEQEEVVDVTLRGLCTRLTCPHLFTMLQRLLPTFRERWIRAMPPNERAFVQWDTRFPLYAVCILAALGKRTGLSRVVSKAKIVDMATAGDLTVQHRMMLKPSHRREKKALTAISPQEVANLIAAVEEHCARELALEVEAVQQRSGKRHSGSMDTGVGANGHALDSNTAEHASGQEEAVSEDEGEPVPQQDDENVPATRTETPTRRGRAHVQRIPSSGSGVHVVSLQKSHSNASEPETPSKSKSRAYVEMDGKYWQSAMEMAQAVDGPRTPRRRCVANPKSFAQRWEEYERQTRTLRGDTTAAAATSKSPKSSTANTPSRTPRKAQRVVSFDERSIRDTPSRGSKKRKRDVQDADDMEMDATPVLALRAQLAAPVTGFTTMITMTSWKESRKYKEYLVWRQHIEQRLKQAISVKTEPL